MTLTIELTPHVANYIAAKPSEGEFASTDALIDALIEERIAREADYERWLRSKVTQGLEAAERGNFASEVQIEAVLRRNDSI